MEQKSFFRKRTPEEMRDGYAVRQIYSQRGLVDRIWGLDAVHESLEIRTPLLSPALFGNNITQAQVSRREFKHGELISLDQPLTRESAYEYPYDPLTARMQAFERFFRGRKEEEINYIGISWRPVQGRDRRKRVVPFEVALEGTRIYNYAINRATGITLDDRYINALRVEREGGTVLCKVPSRTKRREHYHINLVHVPIVANKESNAIILSLRSQYERGREPERITFLHHLRYTFKTESESQDIFVFGPHDVAAYLALIKKYWKGLQNTLPLKMNPFPLPSKNWANFYDKLNNNVAIYDPTLTSRQKLRNLHIAEKCILLGRSIAVKGSYETAFWDEQRDGKLRYYWQ